MKRIFAFVLALLLICPALVSCQDNVAKNTDTEEKLRLSHFVGVWTNQDSTIYYRFTPTSQWFRFNSLGEVEAKGSVTFEGKEFVLMDENEYRSTLTVQDKEHIVDYYGTVFVKTDSPSSLISSSDYNRYFNSWYEDGNLNGNVLTVEGLAHWTYSDPKGNLLLEGDFYGYAGENDILYLYTDPSGEFYSTLQLIDNVLLMNRYLENRTETVEFLLQEDSVEKSYYFKEKGIPVDYYLGAGNRLLRNGGAAYNDSHDYKKMPVSCRIDMTKDTVNSEGLRLVEVVVTYEFKRSDMPSLTGSRIYNSVRFSQYDYYTGEAFFLEDSTGTEHQTSIWTVMREETEVSIQCDFTSVWEYPKNNDVLVRWYGTYHLTMPADYDGFVICLRPVFNSYAAQISASVSPPAGTLCMEDLGEDVTKAIFCRIDKKYANVVTLD